MCLLESLIHFYFPWYLDETQISVNPNENKIKKKQLDKYILFLKSWKLCVWGHISISALKASLMFASVTHTLLYKSCVNIAVDSVMWDSEVMIPQGSSENSISQCECGMLIIQYKNHYCIECWSCMYWLIANLWPRYSYMFLYYKTALKQRIRCCSWKLDFTKLNALNISICKLLCSTSRLNQIMQQFVLHSFFLWTSRMFGDKVHWLWNPVQPPLLRYCIFIAWPCSDGSPQNPLTGGKSWPRLSRLTYVLIVAMTPWLTGAGDGWRRKTWLALQYTIEHHLQSFNVVWLRLPLWL